MGDCMNSEALETAPGQEFEVPLKRFGVDKRQVHI